MSELENRLSKISIVYGDIFKMPVDILILKYADAFRGADLRAAEILGISNKISLSRGEHRSFRSNERIAAPLICFVGVGRLGDFRYQQIREFGRNVPTIAKVVQPGARQLAITIHGPGYGLDEREAVFALFAGIIEAGQPTERFDSKADISIIIVEKDKKRYGRIQGYLDEFLKFFAGQLWDQRLSFGRDDAAFRGQFEKDTLELMQFGAVSEEKPHVFVAMPFAKEYIDEWELGLREPVNELGFLCERMDAEVYTGDVLQHIKRRIESCNVLLAILTGDNPNVYLEIGYAWGKGIPTVLVVREGHKVRFDVQGQRHLTYESVYDLRKKIKTELEDLRKRRLI
ncbi:hypothetical protein ACLF3G_23590 [Falsiroseomonas sp. HC035]|uniref:hypothetical protein n=1 Tax=Falsiroseomonas sp. HC035 TaxID=3390999 RepID=UPI003D320523